MKLFTFLRSRRLAAILLVVLTAYAWLSTLLSQSSPTRMVAFRQVTAVLHLLRLDRPYSHPVFLALVVWLILSTAACAWERTRFAIRSLRANASSESVLKRLVQSPTSAFIAPEHVSSDALLLRAEDVLRSRKMRVSRRGDMLVASSGSVGLLGSPLFHWALVGLFVFAGLGQLVKYEGVTKVLVGGSFVDSRKNYNESLNRGLLSNGFTGDRIKVERIGFNHVVAGINRGPAPVMTASNDRGRQSAWVYPNHPMRFGSLVIHSLDTAPAFVGTVRSTGTDQRQKIILYYDEGPYVPRTFVLTDRATGVKTTYKVASVEGRRVHVSASHASPAVDKIAGIGETIDLGRGFALTVDDLTAYVQVKVIRDWTVPIVYAMFILGCLASALTVLVAPRSVWVTVHNGALKTLVRHRPTDPAFPRRICEALEALTDSQTNSIKEISA